jgi:hypothetical protein
MLTLSRLYALPLWPGQAMTLTSIAVEVTFGLIPGAMIRAGLYSDSGDGSPSKRIADFGTVAASIGVKTWGPLSTAIPPALTWLTIVQQGGSALQFRARDTWVPVVSETTPLLNSARTAYYVDGVTGALPAIFGAIAGASQGPSALVQLT